MEYDAFISYSHSIDSELAHAIKRGLHLFARPFYKIKALNVFRDETNLSISPELWSVIEPALSQSRYFLLMASKPAAQSYWINREVTYWMEHKSPQSLLLILTHGNYKWDLEKRDFNWSVTDCVPTVLSKQFADEPLVLDLRGFQTNVELSINNPEFRLKIASLAATIHGKKLDDLIGEDIRYKKLLRWALILTGITLLSLLIGLLSFAKQSLDNAERASEQYLIANSRKDSLAVQLHRLDSLLTEERNAKQLASQQTELAISNAKIAFRNEMLAKNSLSQSEANRMTTESLLMGQVDVLEGLLYNYKAWKKYRYPKLAASIVNLFYKDSYSWGDTVFSSPMYRPITDGYSDVLPGYYISPSRNLNYFAIGDPYPQIDASIINRAGKIIGRVNYCQKSEIAFSKDEKYIIPFWGGWCQVFANNAGKIIAHLELEKLEPSCPDVFDGYCINLEDSTGGYNCIEPSPDGRFQIVISGDSILLTFNNLRDKKLLRFPEEVKDVLFSDDSKYFAVNTDNVCYIFKADAFTLINHFYNHKLKLINFSPKNKIVFFNSSQNTVLYSFAGRMLKNLPVKGEICQVSPCEKYFVLVDNRNERKGEDDKARILYKFNMANLELEYYTSFGSDLSPDLQIYTPLSFFSNDDQFLLYHSGASFFLRDNKSGEINEFTSNYNIDFASFDKDDRVVTLCKYAIYEWNMKVCRISEPESKFKTAELLPDDPFHRFTVFAEDAFEAVIQNSPVYQTHYKKISGLENKYFNKHLPRCENVQFSKDGNYLYTIEEKWNTKLEVKTHEWILNPDIIALIVNDFLNKK